MKCFTTQRTKEIIKLLRCDVEEVLSCRLFLERGNAASAISAFPGLGAKTAVLVRKAIEQRLVMSLMQMYDAGTSRGRKNDRDCLDHVFKSLGDSALRNSIAEPGEEARIDEAITRWHSLDATRERRLRNLRDYRLAHAISKKHGSDQPSYDDLMGLARETETIVEALAVGSGVYTVSLQSVANQLIMPHLEDYWLRLEAGQQTP